MCVCGVCEREKEREREREERVVSKRFIATSMLTPETKRGEGVEECIWIGFPLRSAGLNMPANERLQNSIFDGEAAVVQEREHGR